jgi:acetyl esterase/lipase
MARITRRGFIQASSVLAAAPALTAVTARAQPPPVDIGNLRAEKDIVFGKGGEMDMTLDVYRPPEGVTSKRMAIIHLFGGGFFAGNKGAGYIINDAKALGARGYTNVSANYRLQSQGLWPAQLHDVKAAIRWTRANAERIGVDADKIAVAGYSAGGMLALMAAGTNDKPEFEGTVGSPGVSSKVNACIGVYPLASAQIARGLFGEGGATPENIAAASPTTYIGPNFAPTIFIHGTADTTVLPQSSIDFFTKLHAANVPTALTMIQGANHAFDNGALDAVEVMVQSIDLFLDRLFVNPRPYPSFGGGRPGGGRPGRRSARRRWWRARRRRLGRTSAGSVRKVLTGPSQLRAPTYSVAVPPRATIATMRSPSTVPLTTICSPSCRSSKSISLPCRLPATVASRAVPSSFWKVWPSSTSKLSSPVAASNVQEPRAFAGTI